MTRAQAWTLLGILLVAQPAIAQDLAVKDVYFYGHMPNDTVYKEETTGTYVRPGARIRFSSESPLDGGGRYTSNFDVIDLVIKVTNLGREASEEIEVRVALVPRLALIAPGKPPLQINPAETLRTAQWFAPLLILRSPIRRLVGGSSQEVVFERLDTSAIMDPYTRRGLWPTEFRIQASVDAATRDPDLSNNTASRTLKIKFPPP